MFFQIYQWLQWNCSKHCVYILLWCGSRLKNTMNIQRLDMCLRRRHATDSLSLRVFCLLCPKKTDYSKGGLTSMVCKPEGYHIPVFPVQMSRAQVCSLPIWISGLLEFPFSITQIMRCQPRTTWPRDGIVHQSFCWGPPTMARTVIHWWKSRWMMMNVFFWVSEMFQFWYILIICIFAILGTLVWLFVSGCWRLGTGLHHGCGSYLGDPARNCFNV